MDISLQKKLFHKYKSIFRQKDLPMTETCMCWGIDCGNGWYYIIDELCNCITRYVINDETRKVEASQVKQKFGGLRFYISGFSDPYIEGLISMAEGMSYHVCEMCGSSNNVGIISDIYLESLCEKCNIKKRKSRKKSKTRTKK